MLYLIRSGTAFGQVFKSGSPDGKLDRAYMPDAFILIHEYEEIPYTVFQAHEFQYTFPGLTAQLSDGYIFGKFYFEPDRFDDEITEDNDCFKRAYYSWEAAALAAVDFYLEDDGLYIGDDVIHFATKQMEKLLISSDEEETVPLEQVLEELGLNESLPEDDEEIEDDNIACVRCNSPLELGDFETCSNCNDNSFGWIK